MKAQLRRLHSPDVADLRRIASSHSTQGAFLVQAMIGPKEGEGEEAFDFLVCTADWLAQEVLLRRSMWVTEYLVLAEYDYDLLRAAVEQICAQAKGETWEEVALQLNRFARWEFAEYRPGG